MPARGVRAPVRQEGEGVIFKSVILQPVPAGALSRLIRGPQPFPAPRRQSPFGQIMICVGSFALSNPGL